MRSAPAGTSVPGPTAVILPWSNTTVPLAMSPPAARWMVPPTRAMGRSCAAPGVGTAARADAAKSRRAAQALNVRFVFRMLAALPFVDAVLARHVLGDLALHLERILALVARRLRERLLHEGGAHLVLLGAHLEILVAIEVAPAVDPRLLAQALVEERRAAPHHEVGVLSGLERAHLLLDPELAGRIPGHALERFLFREPAVLHRLAGFRVEAARQFVGVGVERHHHARVLHDRGIVRDGVRDLELVGPPVGEGRGPDATLGDLVGHLVALEDVLQRANRGAVLVAHLEQR